MAEGLRLYLTIGPVQTFVAQSRRTRDLWASSFLLSHLAHAAMQAVEQQGGEIVLPARKIQSGTSSSGEVLHGRWPNRFVAKVDDPKAAAEAAKSAILGTWLKIADRVWEDHVKPIAAHSKRIGELSHRRDQRSDISNYEAEVIWNRQINDFWEITWVAALPPQHGHADALACRKNWRTPPVTTEPGDHCTMMGNWQELSGFIRSREREQQNEFWKRLRSRLGKLDLGEDERLCAIALIKRMFPLVAEKTIGTNLNAESWLSTPYIAAIPWLKRVCRKSPDAANMYLEHVKRCRHKWRRENPSVIPSLQQLLNENCPDILRLDGDFLHETALRNSSDTPFEHADVQPPACSSEERNNLLRELETLCRAMDGERPTSFYAMLMMDGDSMGQLLSDARRNLGDRGEQEVTQALGEFAESVPLMVGRHDGVTVYCGGDDVLAMLPVDSVLRCARGLSELYRKTFAKHCSAFAERATISAGIVFCSFRTPFLEVIGLAHRLLDQVAKDATGRDSLAAAVLKSGGVTCQWAAPWKHLLDGDSTILDALVQRLRDRRGRIGELSSGFLFQIRERFAGLTNEPLTVPGRFGCLPDGIDVEALLLGEYRRARIHQRESDNPVDSPQSRAAETVKLFLKVCRRTHRADGVDMTSLGVDGPLLVRFLAGETRETAGEEATE